jgi:hypothetical protein
MRSLKFAIFLAALILVSSVASASIVLKLDVPDMTRLSHAVVVGQVVDTRSEWNSKHEYIQTFTTIRVENPAKGAHEAGQIITVRELGGSVGDYNQAMIGAPTYAPGEKVLVFLERAADGTPGIFQTLALSAGKFIVSTDSQTGRTIAVPAAHDLMYADDKPTMFDRGPVDLDIVLDEVRRHGNDQ